MLTVGSKQYGFKNNLKNFKKHLTNASEYDIIHTVKSDDKHRNLTKTKIKYWLLTHKVI